MLEEEKKQRKEKDKRQMRLLLKFDIFLLLVIVTTGIANNRIVVMFNLEGELAVHVSLAIGFVFAGLVFLSLRTHKSTKKEKRQ